MSRVLVTGMSGAGKTTVLDELRRRGHRTVDTDYGDWVSPAGTWDERRMGLLASHPDVVSGTVPNQGRLRPIRACGAAECAHRRPARARVHPDH